MQTSLCEHNVQVKHLVWQSSWHAGEGWDWFLGCVWLSQTKLSWLATEEIFTPVRMLLFRRRNFGFDPNAFPFTWHVTQFDYTQIS